MDPVKKTIISTKVLSAFIAAVIYLFIAVNGHANLFITEIHQQILFGNIAEQWVELYNSSPNSVTLTDASISFNNGGGNITINTFDSISGTGYYVIAFGAPSSSDFADTTNIDAYFTPGVSLNTSGDIITFSMGGSVIDQVDYRGGEWDSLLASTKTQNASGETIALSMMLLDATTGDGSLNDFAQNWGLADPGDLMANSYSNTGRHFGSPGGEGTALSTPIPGSISFLLLGLGLFGIVKRKQKNDKNG